MLGNVFFFCAVTGGTFLICQFILLIIGIGAHDLLGGDNAEAEIASPDHAGGAGDYGHQHSSTLHGGWLLAMFSIRTLSAAITFFGLAGMAAGAGGLPPIQQFIIALITGWLALVCVYKLVVFVRRLGRDETVRIESVIGQSATVYLPIPAAGSGVGKVFVKAQNRQMEYPASTTVSRTLIADEQVKVVDFKGLTLVVVPDSENS